MFCWRKKKAESPKNAAQAKMEEDLNIEEEIVLSPLDLYHVWDSANGRSQPQQGPRNPSQSDTSEDNGTVVVTRAVLHWVKSDSDTSSEGNSARLSFTGNVTTSDARTVTSTGGSEEGFEEIDLSGKEQWEDALDSQVDCDQTDADDKDLESQEDDGKLDNGDEESKADSMDIVAVAAPQQTDSETPSNCSTSTLETPATSLRRSVTFDPEIEINAVEYDETTPEGERAAACWPFGKCKHDMVVVKQPRGRNQQGEVEQPPAAMQWRNNPFYVEQRERAEREAREREEWLRRPACERACLCCIGAWAFCCE